MVEVSIEGEVPSQLFIDGRAWQVGPMFVGWDLEPGLHCVSTAEFVGCIFWLQDRMGFKLSEDIQMVPFKPGRGFRKIDTEPSWREKTNHVLKNFEVLHLYPTAPLPFVTALNLKASLDRSHQLRDLGVGSLLSELQLTWIIFTNFSHFEAFVQWRSLLKLLNTSFAYWREHSPEPFFDILRSQLSEYQLAEELPVEESLRLAQEFHELCEEVGDEEFASFLEERFGLVYIPDPEDLPVICDE